jgi:excisionase family DNA binding protein
MPTRTAATPATGLVNEGGTDRRSSIGRQRPDPGSGARVPKFFTVYQVAEALDVHPCTVRRWIKNGDLVTHRFGGAKRGAVRIAATDLKAFLALHRDA